MASTAPTSGWSEPPWTGWIATTGDALLMLEAARRGVIPRVTRRLVDSERKMIASGSVFVFDEDESGIKRWTDGLFWSPSRILGNFLLYRETDKRGAGHRRAEKPAPQEPWEGADAERTPEASLSRPKGESSKLGVDRQRERSLVGSLTNSYKFKHNGLMKKTFSLTIAGVSQHLISYYKVEDVESGRLRTPTSIPELSALEISPEYLDKTHFRIPPKVELGRDGRPHYVGEAEDIGSDVDPAAVLAGLSKPLLTDVPIALEPAGSPTAPKRGKRYEPYDAASPGAVSPTLAAKRRRNKGSISSHPDSAGSPTSSPGHEASPTLSSPEDGPGHFGYPPLPPTGGYYAPYAPSTSAGAGGAPSYTYPAPSYPGGQYASFAAPDTGAPQAAAGAYYYPGAQQPAYPGGYAWTGGSYAGGGGYHAPPPPPLAYPGGGPSSHAQNQQGDSPTRGA